MSFVPTELHAPPGSTAAGYLLVHNGAEEPAVITVVTLSQQGSLLTISGLYPPFSIEPHGAEEFKLVFHPINPGTTPGTIEVRSSVGDASLNVVASSIREELPATGVPRLMPDDVGEVPPDGRAAIVPTDPVVLGALDRSVIDAVIKRNMNQLRYCYSRELTQNPGLEGRIVVKFVIARDGTVSSATTGSSTMASPRVETCLNARFQNFQFPEPAGGGIVIVKYPFVFSPG